MSLIDLNYFNGEDVFYVGGFGLWKINIARALAKREKCTVLSDILSYEF